MAEATNKMKNVAGAAQIAAQSAAGAVGKAATQNQRVMGAVGAASAAKASALQAAERLSRQESIDEYERRLTALADVVAGEA